MKSVKVVLLTLITTNIVGAMQKKGIEELIISSIEPFGIEKIPYKSKKQRSTPAQLGFTIGLSSALYNLKNKYALVQKRAAQLEQAMQEESVPGVMSDVVSSEASYFVKTSKDRLAKEEALAKTGPDLNKRKEELLEALLKLETSLNFLTARHKLAAANLANYMGISAQKLSKQIESLKQLTKKEGS